MLAMMMVLGFGSTAIEMMLVYKIKPMRDAFRRWTVLGLLFSFVMSWFMGMIFGAPTGLIIFGGAIMSTALSAIIYSLHLIELFEITMEKAAVMKVATVQYAHKAQASFEDVKNVAHNTRVKYNEGKNKVKRTAFCVRHPVRAILDK
jgi:hypothetical protein